MKVAISGSTGLVGSALVEHLRSQGHEVVRIVRGAPAEHGPSISWNPDKGELAPGSLRGIEAVINLSGENIAAKRWSQKQKQIIRNSRVNATRTIVNAIAGATDGPCVLINASATGFYGDRAAETLSELSNPGHNFLAQICREWEAEADRLKSAGKRVVRARLGVVLSKDGGALQKMLPIFNLGGGGNLGSGRQYMPWIDLHDLVRAFEFVLSDGSISGPVNMVAPTATTNADFTKALASVLHRPAILPAPAFGLKLALGEMADELLLASAKVEPKVLLERGFRFEHADLRYALESALGRAPVAQRSANAKVVT